MDWKKTLIFGSFAAGAVLFLTGRRPAGLAVAGIGVATLAAEHPEKMQELWRRLPEYVDRSGKLVDTAANILWKLAEHRRGYRIPAARQARSAQLQTVQDASVGWAELVEIALRGDKYQIGQTSLRPRQHHQPIAFWNCLSVFLHR